MSWFGRDVLVSAGCPGLGGMSSFERGCRLSRVSLFGQGVLVWAGCPRSGWMSSFGRGCRLSRVSLFGQGVLVRGWMFLFAASEETCRERPT